MKYWRGYLVAAVLALCTWALCQFCANHVPLVDMVYPYVDRIIMDYLAGWSSNFAGCLWQTVVVFLMVLAVASAVLMIVLRWNPIQWFGWVLAVLSVLNLLNVGIYGLNEYSGPIAEDIRLEVNEYSVGSLERAAAYYRDMANEYADKVSRKADGSLDFQEFDAMAQQAGEGFGVLTYERTYPIFSGTTVPVKELGWVGRYDGEMGVTVGLTGESAVNPNVPAAAMPYAMCREMCRRMCIYNLSDASFGAFLACTANPDAEFAYSGYLMAFRSCYNALSSIRSNLGSNALDRVMAGVDPQVMEDMGAVNGFLGENATEVDADLCNLLVSWHIQEVAQYENAEEEDVFDPMDETNDQLEDIVNPYGE